MNIEQSHSELLKKYMNLFFDWHRLIVFFLLAAVSAGYVVYLKEPKFYESQASIMYQQQRINPSRLSPDDEKQFGEMVNTVSQQVLSRANLESIILQHDLYPEMRQNVPIEDVIENMRNKHISITMGRGKGSVFSVSYTGRQPDTTMRVTNALAAQFIEENLRFREERASDTTRYIQDELQMSKAVLEKKEAEMRDYKLKYYNEMPDQRPSNMARLNGLQEQYQATQRRIHDLEQTRMLLSEQLENRRNLYKLETGVVDGQGRGREIGGRNELTQARRDLQNMLSRYTTEHPAVIRARNRVEQLEAEYASIEGQEEAAGGEGLTAADMEARDPRIIELTTQLRELDLNVETLRKEAVRIRERMQQYEAWIDAAPVREAEWSALTRDYNQLRNYHDQLLSQSLAAEASESLERRQQGSQFKIVDPAYLPRTPVKGTFVNTLLMATMAGLAIGVGLMMGITTMDTSFKDVKEVEKYLEMPVTCALPLVATKDEKRQERIISILWYLFYGAWLLFIAAGTVYFYMRGEIIL